MHISEVSAQCPHSAESSAKLFNATDQKHIVWSLTDISLSRMPNKKKGRNSGVEYWNSSHSVQTHTVSQGIFTIWNKSNTTERGNLHLFRLYKQILLEWTSNSMFLQIQPEAVCLLHADAINIWKIFFSSFKTARIKITCSWIYPHANIIVWFTTYHHPGFWYLYAFFFFLTYSNIV